MVCTHVSRKFLIEAETHGAHINFAFETGQAINDQSTVREKLLGNKMAASIQNSLIRENVPKERHLEKTVSWLRVYCIIIIIIIIIEMSIIIIESSIPTVLLVFFFSLLYRYNQYYYNCSCSSKRYIPSPAESSDAIGDLIRFLNPKS